MGELGCWVQERTGQACSGDQPPPAMGQGPQWLRPFAQSWTMLGSAGKGLGPACLPCAGHGFCALMCKV